MILTPRRTLIILLSSFTYFYVRLDLDLVIQTLLKHVIFGLKFVILFSIDKFSFILSLPFAICISITCAIALFELYVCTSNSI